METKERTRERLQTERNRIFGETAQIRALKLAEQLKKQAVVRERGYLYAYYPHGSELSLLPFLDWALAAGKRVALPRVAGEQMDFYEITALAEAAKGAFGVMEPVTERKVAWEEAVCLVPGIGFTEDGRRIGHGKGFYDRYLQKHPRLVRVGITYEEQITAELFTQETDIAMEYLATPQRWVACR